jgi:hypothetical protein
MISILYAYYLEWIFWVRQFWKGGVTFWHMVKRVHGAKKVENFLSSYRDHLIGGFGYLVTNFRYSVYKHLWSKIVLNLNILLPSLAHALSSCKNNKSVWLCVRLGALVALTVRITVFSDVTPGSPAHGYRYFGGVCCLVLQGVRYLRWILVEIFYFEGGGNVYNHLPDYTKSHLRRYHLIQMSMSVTCLLKARIAEPEETAVARKRLSKHASAATNTRTQH